MNPIEPAWDLYRTVLAVLDEGSLSGAARRLGLTQPTVSRQIEALEAALGVGLFTRSRQGLSPTEAALALRPYAETLRATAAALVRATAAAGTQSAGSVRITASEVIGVEVVPRILAGLRAEHPALAIELVLSDRIDDLLQREADIAIRMVEPRQAALLARRIGRIGLGLHAHRDYLAQHGVPRDLADLACHAGIGYDRETDFIRGMELQRYGLVRENFALRCDSALAQLAAIRASFGIGLCQIGLARRDPALVRLLPDIDIGMNVFVVMHEDLKSLRRCRVVFDALVRGMADYVEGAG